MYQFDNGHCNPEQENNPVIEGIRVDTQHIRDGAESGAPYQLTKPCDDMVRRKPRFPRPADAACGGSGSSSAGSANQQRIVEQQAAIDKKVQIKQHCRTYHTNRGTANVFSHSNTSHRNNYRLPSEHLRAFLDRCDECVYIFFCVERCKRNAQCAVRARLRQTERLEHTALLALGAG